MSARDTLVATLDELADDAVKIGSPFYQRLCEHMRDDAAAGGPTWDLLERYAEERPDEFYPYRALGGVHHEVLAGTAPELAKHYPSVGGDGDADAAWPLVREVLERHDPDVVGALRHPLQTNETSRAGALIGGFLTIAAETGLPLRVRELGSSAGLNLHFDQYRYEAGGKAFGPADSPVRFTDYWLEGTPPLDAPLEVVDRRGCDIDPIDATTEQGRLTLLSYMWPDELPRFELMKGALEIAQEMPVTVDQEGVDTWAQRQLAELPDGEATVVFHSIVWPYLDDDVREATQAAIEEAATRASAEHPLSWLRYEQSPDYVHCELKLTSWPGGEERLLCTGGNHLEPVIWLA